MDHITLGPHFTLEELVPPKVHKEWGSNAIWFLDPTAVFVLRLCRRRYGPVTVNDWKWDGSYTESGYRLPDTSEGAQLSQHKFGRAFDMKFEGITPDQVRDDIMDNEELFLAAGLTTIEASEYAPTWVHIDVRPTNMDHIFVVKPN